MKRLAHPVLTLLRVALCTTMHLYIQCARCRVRAVVLFVQARVATPHNTHTHAHRQAIKHTHVFLYVRKNADDLCWGFFRSLCREPQYGIRASGSHSVHVNNVYRIHNSPRAHAHNKRISHVCVVYKYAHAHALAEPACVRNRTCVRSEALSEDSACVLARTPIRVYT